MSQSVAPNVGYSGGPFDDNITYQGNNYRWGNTQGVTSNYANITNIALKEGRFITDSDDQQRANVIVIGVNAADALFPGQTNIAGTQVRMGGYNFEIVGVLEKRKAGFFGENEEDNAVFMPFRTAQKVAPATRLPAFCHSRPERAGAGSPDSVGRNSAKTSSRGV